MTMPARIAPAASCNSRMSRCVSMPAAPSGLRRRRRTNSVPSSARQPDRATGRNARRQQARRQSNRPRGVTIPCRSSAATSIKPNRTAPWRHVPDHVHTERRSSTIPSRSPRATRALPCPIRAPSNAGPAAVDAASFPPSDEHDLPVRADIDQKRRR